MSPQLLSGQRHKVTKNPSSRATSDHPDSLAVSPRHGRAEQWPKRLAETEDAPFSPICRSPAAGESTSRVCDRFQVPSTRFCGRTRREEEKKYCPDGRKASLLPTNASEFSDARLALETHAARRPDAVDLVASKRHVRHCARLLWQRCAQKLWSPPVACSSYGQYIAS